MNSYRAVQLDPGQLEPMLRSLWQRNLSDAIDPDQRFDWYQRNPVGRAVTVSLESTNEGGASTMVGSTGISRRQFYLQGRRISSGLLGDFNVDRSHRTLFPAMVLQREVLHHCREHFDFSYGFPNVPATAVMRRIGYVVLGKRCVYVRPLSFAAYAGRLIANRTVARGAALLADQVLEHAQRLRAAPISTLYRLEWLSDVDRRFDLLWQRVHRRYPIISCRGADQLRWRFVERPCLDYRFAALVHRLTGRLEAYAAIQLQVEQETAYLCDLFSADERSTGRLLALLVVELRKRGFRRAVISYLGAPETIRALRWQGFSLRGEDSIVFVVDPSRCSAAEAGTLRDPDNWHLTSFDADV